VIEIRRYLTAAGQDVFGEWLSELKDVKARARIAMRIDRLANGNFGDAKSIGGGLRELRIDWGPGYRVYYGMAGTAVVLLLCAGDNVSRLPTLRARARIGKTTKRERSSNET
jgi:putative addiction module killer protein